MTGALLSAALGLLVWPPRASVARARIGEVMRGSVAGAGLPSWAGAPPRPLLAACLAGAGAAVLSTGLVAGLAAAVAALGAVGWQRRQRARQEDARLGGLTEGLGALTAELRSGRSLAAATAAAASVCPGEAAAALAQAVRAPGAPAAHVALPGSRQWESAALDRISAAVLLSTRTGCSLAVVLAALETDLRARRRAQAELRAAVAGPQASAVLLACLPALGLAMGSGVGADPWRVLTATGTGQVLLVAGVALEVVGIAWSGRLIRRAIR
jgi:tight adherence protein B